MLNATYNNLILFLSFTLYITIFMTLTDVSWVKEKYKYFGTKIIIDNGKIVSDTIIT